MILKGKDVDWRIDIGYTGWSQQIPSFQGFELIVMGTSQRFYWLTVIVERITVDLGGSEGHHGTMGSTAIKWSLFWGGIRNPQGLSDWLHQNPKDSWLSIKVPGALFDPCHICPCICHQSFLPWLPTPTPHSTMANGPATSQLLRSLEHTNDHQTPNAMELHLVRTALDAKRTRRRMHVARFTIQVARRNGWSLNLPALAALI